MAKNPITDMSVRTQIPNELLAVGEAERRVAELVSVLIADPLSEQTTPLQSRETPSGPIWQGQSVRGFGRVASA